MKLQFKALALAATMIIAGSAVADPFDLSTLADPTMDYASRSSAIADIIAAADPTAIADSVAVINQTGAAGLAVALIDQAGDGAGFNMAFIDQDASVNGAVATIFQNGSGNLASIHQDGAINPVSALIMQAGVNNKAQIYQH